MWLTLPVPQHGSILLPREPLLQILNPLLLVCPDILAGLEFLNFLNSFLSYIYITSVWEGRQATERSRANPTDMTSFDPLNPAITDASPAHVLSFVYQNSYF